MQDISNREDCERLVRAFYERALVDPIIGWIFTDVAHLDVEAHVPQIASFWETILLGAQSYSGGAFRPHAELNAKVTLRSGQQLVVRSNEASTDAAPDSRPLPVLLITPAG